MTMELPAIARIAAALVAALLISFIATPVVKSIAQMVGAVDVPKDNRRMHNHPIPRMGGLAIFLGFLLSTLIFVPMSSSMRGMLLGGVIIVILGIFDDIYALPALPKLLVQIAAALVAVLHGNVIQVLSNPNIFSENPYWTLGSLAVPLSVIWIVAITNAVNLIDGLDGLAAGVSAIASMTVILVAVQMGYYHIAVMTAALAGGIIGFIRYNFNPATIFMGDTGSMFIGYMLAAISVYGAVKTAATVALIVPAIALGLPIMDTAFAIMRRYSNGRPIFQPDKGHLHHRLLAMGMNQKQAVLLMYAITAVLGIAAVLWAEFDGFYAALIIAVIITAVAVGAKKIGILNDR